MTRIPKFVYIILCIFPLVWSVLLVMFIVQELYPMVAVFSLVLIGGSIGIYFGLRGPFNYTRLLKKGIRGTGSFKNATVIRKSSYDNLILKLELEIEIPGKPTWTAFTRTATWIVFESELVAGKTFPVMVDPRDPQNVVIINSIDLNKMNSPLWQKK